MTAQEETLSIAAIGLVNDRKSVPSEDMMRYCCTDHANLNKTSAIRTSMTDKDKDLT